MLYKEVNFCSDPGPLGDNYIHKHLFSPKVCAVWKGLHRKLYRHVPTLESDRIPAETLSLMASQIDRNQSKRQQTSTILKRVCRW